MVHPGDVFYYAYISSQQNHCIDRRITDPGTRNQLTNRLDQFSQIYIKAEFAERYNCSTDTTTDDFEEMGNQHLEPEKVHRRIE